MTNPDPPIASGCFTCPIIAGTALTWDGPTALPNLDEPDRGYFSVPLSAWYLPITDVLQIGDALVGEISASQALDFAFISLHEHWHQRMNLWSPVKVMIRFAAVSAWVGIAEIAHMRGTETSWSELDSGNALISVVTSALAPVEEVVTTLFAMRVLRHQVGRGQSTPELDLVEERALASQIETYGEVFGQLYEIADRVRRRAGDELVILLAIYAQEGLQIDPSSGHISASGVARRSDIIYRFHAGLDLIDRSWQRAMTRWDGARWQEFLRTHLAGYESWEAESENVRQWAEASMRFMRNRWQQLASALPLTSPEFHQFGEVTPSWASGDVPIIAAGPAAMYEAPYSPVDGVLEASRAGVRITMPHVDHWEGWPVRPKLWEREREVQASLRALHADARARGRALVVVQPPDQGTGTVCFVPIKRADRTSAQAVFVSGAGLRHGDPRIAEAVFYEGLRCQLALKRGVECPMKNAQLWWGQGEGRCCGRGEQLVALWDAERRRGRLDETWSPPSSCAQPNRNDGLTTGTA